MGARLFVFWSACWLLGPLPAHAVGHCGGELRGTLIESFVEHAFATQVIAEYHHDGTLDENENLKHVKRMIDIVRLHRQAIYAVGGSPDVIELAIWVSDMGKTSHLIARHLSEFGEDLFTAILNHHKISLSEANAMRVKLGIGDDRWQQIVAGVIGHDGPALPNTFLGDNYPRLNGGHSYDDIMLGSVDGFLHAFLDRLDQGGLVRDASGVLQGGLRKISYLELGRKTRDPATKDHAFAAAITDIFSRLVGESIRQIENLVERRADFLGPDHEIPDFLKAPFARMKQLREHYADFVGMSGATVFLRLPGGTVRFQQFEDRVVVTEYNSAGRPREQQTYSLDDALGVFWRRLASHPFFGVR